VKYLYVTDRWFTKLLYVPKPSTQDHAWKVCTFVAAQCKLGNVLSVSKFI